MYKRVHTFLNNKNIIYQLQFGFRHQYYTSIRKALGDGNIGCGVFVTCLIAIAMYLEMEINLVLLLSIVASLKDLL